MSHLPGNKPEQGGVPDSLRYSGSKQDFTENLVDLVTRAVLRAEPCTQAPVTDILTTTMAIAEIDDTGAYARMDHWYDWKNGYHTVSSSVRPRQGAEKYSVNKLMGLMEYHRLLGDILSGRPERSTWYAHADKGVWLPGVYAAHLTVELHVRKTKLTSQTDARLALWRDLPGRGGFVSQRVGVKKTTNRSRVHYEVGNYCSVDLHGAGGKNTAATPDWIADYVAGYPPDIPLRQLTWSEWTGLIKRPIGHKDLLEPWPPEIEKKLDK